MSLPSDPFILLSYVNTKLRDNYNDLNEFCSNENISISELKDKLSAVGFEYDENLNRFG